MQKYERFKIQFSIIGNRKHFRILKYSITDVPFVKFLAYSSRTFEFHEGYFKLNRTER